VAREVSAAGTRLAAAEARADTLGLGHDALLQRIMPETQPEAKQATGEED
jgi:hypothetical protein